MNESKENDKMMIATNGPDVNNTIVVLKKLIDAFFQHTDPNSF